MDARVRATQGAVAEGPEVTAGNTTPEMEEDYTNAGVRATQEAVAELAPRRKQVIESNAGRLHGCRW